MFFCCLLGLQISFEITCSEFIAMVVSRFKWLSSKWLKINFKHFFSLFQRLLRVSLLQYNSRPIQLHLKSEEVQANNVKIKSTFPFKAAGVYYIGRFQRLASECFQRSAFENNLGKNEYYLFQKCVAIAIKTNVKNRQRILFTICGLFVAFKTFWYYY